MLNKLNEKIDFLVRKISKSDNPNKIAKTKKALIFVSFVFVVFISFKMYKSYKHYKKMVQIEANQDINFKSSSLIDQDYLEDNAKSALEEQQEDIDDHERRLKDVSDLVKSLQNKIEKTEEELRKGKSAFQQDLLKQQREFEKKLKEAKEEQKTSSLSDHIDNKTSKGANEGAFGNNSMVMKPTRVAPKIASKTFKNTSKKNEFIKTPKTWFQAGGYCQGILLNGADAHAGVTASSKTSPVLIMLNGKCTLPQGMTSSKLKGAHVLASVFGEISSERGVMRLERISFRNKKDGSIIEMPVEGYVADISGKNGVKGITTLNNDKLLWGSVLAGTVAGLGDVTNQQSRTQSVTGGGIVDVVNPSQAAVGAVGGGIGRGATNVDRYITKLVEAHAPVIDIRAGGIVDVVFMMGFPLEDKDAIKLYTKQIQGERAQVEETAANNVKKAAATSPTIPDVVPQIMNQRVTPNMSVASPMR